MGTAIKVVIEQNVLHPVDGHLQRVASVYLDGEPLRVYAPEKASGNPLEWVEHFSVHRYDSGGEADVAGPLRVLVIRAVIDELERMKSETTELSGNIPGEDYCYAQICVRGHVLSSDGMPFVRGQYCPQCGSACIDSCQKCAKSIRGHSEFAGGYSRPSFCYGCGQPYPWMKDKLDTARELLSNDDKLSLDERKELWDLLQYVMSDPKNDLVPAKKKLISIKLGKAAKATQDIVLDLIAKYAAEMSKP